MPVEYYLIPLSDKDKFFYHEGSYKIEPTELYDSRWILASNSLDHVKLPQELLDKTKSYDYWTSIDPRWFKTTYDYIQSLEVADNFEDGTTAEYIEDLKASIPPISIPNSRNPVVQWGWNPLLRLWNMISW